MDKKYIYTNNYFHGGWNRYEITRETESNVWFKYANGNEIKISKKTYRANDSRYYQETPEILKKWIIDNKKRRYFNHLEKLKKCTSISVMDLVLSIQIPGQQIQPE